jgi:O-antigen ligase
VTERIPKSILIAAVILGPLLLAYFAYARPWYFTSDVYLGGLVLLELLAVAVWMYRRVFFPFVIVTFLLAGLNLPVGAVWTSARWLVLGLGAAVGSAITLKERPYRFGLFHLVALSAVLTALVSAAVSQYTSTSLLKVLSLLLLFVYAATGARLAVTGRENRFFAGLLTGCEALVGVIAAFYFLGIEIMGNPNSLGAVTGVVGAPVLLWGTLLSGEPFAHRRRLVLCAISMYLTVASRSRAGMVAALLSCGLLCLVLRRYRLMAQGIGVIVILVAAAAILQPEALSRTVSSLTASLVYKSKDERLGLLASRESPWQHAIDTISNHFWFGTGFGTADKVRDPTEDLEKFSSSTATSAEHGSSYLAITTWVGMFGVLPFFVLLLVLLRKVIQTFVWMLRTGNPSHPAVPLAAVMLAGMLHAGLEDWLFAPGYYLCVFYWCMAFVFVDQAPSPALADSRRIFFRRTTGMPQTLGDVASSR